MGETPGHVPCRGVVAVVWCRWAGSLVGVLHRIAVPSLVPVVAWLCSLSPGWVVIWLAGWLSVWLHSTNPKDVSLKVRSSSATSNAIVHPGQVASDSLNPATRSEVPPFQRPILFNQSESHDKKRVQHDSIPVANANRSKMQAQYRPFPQNVPQRSPHVPAPRRGGIGTSVNLNPSFAFSPSQSPSHVACPCPAHHTPPPPIHCFPCASCLLLPLHHRRRPTTACTTPRPAPSQPCPRPSSTKHHAQQQLPTPSPPWPSLGKVRHHV